MKHLFTIGSNYSAQYDYISRFLWYTIGICNILCNRQVGLCPHFVKATKNKSDFISLLGHYLNHKWTAMDADPHWSPIEFRFYMCTHGSTSTREE
jgi:hypothetical protein